MAITEAALNALLIGTRNASSRSPLDPPVARDQRSDLERRCRDVIQTEPHLELAAWLAEAWTLSRGLEGLRDGLQLVTQLLDERWNELLPEVVDFDREEARIAQLSALDAQLSHALLTVPVSMSNDLSLGGYLQLRLVERFSKDEAEEYERMQPEQMEEARRLARVWGTTLQAGWCLTLLQGRLREATAAVNDYTRVAEQRMLSGYWVPNVRDLLRTREMLSRFERAVQEATIEESSAPPEPVIEPLSTGSEIPAALATSASDQAPLFQPENREEAIRYLVEATLFLCRDDPDGLACLMLERAARLAVAGSRDAWFDELRRIGRRGKTP